MNVGGEFFLNLNTQRTEVSRLASTPSATSYPLEYFGSPYPSYVSGLFGEVRWSWKLLPHGNRVPLNKFGWTPTPHSSPLFCCFSQFCVFSSFLLNSRRDSPLFRALSFGLKYLFVGNQDDVVINTEGQNFPTRCIVIDKRLASSRTTVTILWRRWISTTCALMGQKMSHKGSFFVAPYSITSPV